MKPKGEITYKPNTTIKEIKIAVHIISAIAIIVCVIGIVLDENYFQIAKERIESQELIKQVEKIKKEGYQDWEGMR